MRYTLYFAYGSNMDERQFARRCPDSFFLGKARLRGHRFVITSQGYASVQPRAGATVHGVLCALTATDERTLDKQEGVGEAGGYRRAWRAVIAPSGETVTALVYVDDTAEEGAPKAGYLEKVLHGAKYHRLPARAMAAIARWAKWK